MIKPRTKGIIKLLVDNGADVNAKNYNDVTVLMNAVTNSNHNGTGFDEEIVRYLLNKGANPRAENKNRETAFTIARKLKKSRVMTLINNAMTA